MDIGNLKSNSSSNFQPLTSNIQIDDKPHEECGVIGIFAPNEDVARMAFFGLHALQHRGQEAAGIAVTDGEPLILTLL